MGEKSEPKFIPGLIPEEEKLELKKDMTLAQNADGTLRVIKSKKDLPQAAKEFREGQKDRG